MRIVFTATLGLVMLGVILPVGIGISTQVYNNLNTTDMSTEGRTAFDSLYDGIWQGYQLMSTSPTIFAASAIISILVSGFAMWLFGRTS